MDPDDRSAHIDDAARSQASHTVAEAAADLRVSLTTILGRSQLLERRIRNGQITNVYACMETLGQIDAVVREMTERLHRLEEEQ